MRGAHRGETFRLALEVDRARADAIFISYTNFRTLEIIERLQWEKASRW